MQRRDYCICRGRCSLPRETDLSRVARERKLPWLAMSWIEHRCLHGDGSAASFCPRPIVLPGRSTFLSDEQWSICVIGENDCLLKETTPAVAVRANRSRRPIHLRAPSLPGKSGPN